MIMDKMINGLYNIKYKVENLVEAIEKEEITDKFRDELYDVDVAIKYVEQIIKAHTRKRNK